MQKVLLLSLLLASLLNIAYSCQSMKINGVTYYCPMNSSLKITSSSVTCNGRPASTSCDDSSSSGSGGSSSSSSSTEDSQPQNKCPRKFGPYSGYSKSRATSLAKDLEKCEEKGVAFTYKKQYYKDSSVYYNYDVNYKVVDNSQYKSQVLKSGTRSISQRVKSDFEDDVENLDWSCWCTGDCNYEENLEKMRDRYSKYYVSAFRFINGSGYPDFDEYNAGVAMGTRKVECYNDYYYYFVLH